MTITRVQSNANTANGFTTVNATLGVGVTQGNLLVACFAYGQLAETVTLPDASWGTAADSIGATNEQSAEIYYLLVDAGHAGATSWTFTVTASAKLLVTIAEWSSTTGWAASPVDKSATNTSTSTATTIDSGTTATTTQASELWVAALSYAAAAQTESSLTAGWTSGQEATISTGHTVREVYQVVSSTGAAHASFVIGTAEHWGGAVATFKTAAGATHLRIMDGYGGVFS